MSERVSERVTDECYDVIASQFGPTLSLSRSLSLSLSALQALEALSSFSLLLSKARLLCSQHWTQLFFFLLSSFFFFFFCVPPPPFFCSFFCTNPHQCCSPWLSRTFETGANKKSNKNNKESKSRRCLLTTMWTSFAKLGRVALRARPCWTFARAARLGSTARSFGTAGGAAAAAPAALELVNDTIAQALDERFFKVQSVDADTSGVHVVLQVR